MAQSSRDAQFNGPHSHVNDTYFVLAETWMRVRNSMLFIAIISWIAAIIGYVSEPESFFSSYLVAFVFCISIALGATFYVMLQHLTGAAWSVTVRRLISRPRASTTDTA